MIHFDDVSVSFNHQTILDHVNLHVKPGEFVSLVGDTGMGKTTLLRLIYFDLLPDSGTVTVGEYNSSSVRRSDIPRLRRHLGIVFQDFKLLEDRNVYSNVAFPLEVTGARRADIRKRTLRVLADIGLSHKRSNRPHELSGGEQQRVVIARALVNEPMMILADEPTGNIDATSARGILQLLQEINSKGTAVILATHNYDIVRTSGSRILRLQEGMLSELQSL